MHQGLVSGHTINQEGRKDAFVATNIAVNEETNPLVSRYIN